jgi:hypothetical protein
MTGMLLAMVVAGGVAAAYAPSVADLDAAARAVGNRRDIAIRIGESVFSTQWPAEVSQISVNQLDDHTIVGLRIWGVKFHRPITQAEFVGEVVTLISKAFAAAPTAEEVDAWASIPIKVGKGTIVTGDLAEPTSRTVFSVTVHRGETAASMKARAAQTASGVFWDLDWARATFKEGD